jgi:DNA-binding response OmpR family regulator
MKTILIAEDDKNLALLYQQELSEEDYEVEVVNDARSAIERVESEPPDLLILDIQMPGMDGIEALGHILGKNNRLPVVLNTAYSNYKDNFMTWAADAYVVKSSDLTELKTTIRDVFTRREAEE